MVHSMLQKVFDFKSQLGGDSGIPKQLHTPHSPLSQHAASNSLPTSTPSTSSACWHQEGWSNIASYQLVKRLLYNKTPW